MCTSVNYSNRNNDHSIRNFAVGTAGVVTAWEAEPYLKKACKLPMHKYIKDEFKSLQGGGYKSYVENAIKQNNLEKDIKVIDLNERTKESVTKLLEETRENRRNTRGRKPSNIDAAKRSEKAGEEIANVLLRILHLNNDNKKVVNAVVRGENAFFDPVSNAVVCNFEKFGAPVFHEIQHKLNSKSSNFLIKTLAQIRNPVAIFGPLIVSATALLTDKKEEGQKQELNDKIKNNCGLLSTLCMLPLTVEEFIANIKGTKIAETAGVTGDMLAKVKKCHKISMISYAAGAVATGLATWGANKIRDIICTQKIPKEQPLAVIYQGK